MKPVKPVAPYSIGGAVATPFPEVLARGELTQKNKYNKNIFHGVAFTGKKTGMSALFNIPDFVHTHTFTLV